MSIFNRLEAVISLNSSHRIDQELVFRPRHARRDVAQDQIIHAEMGDQPIASREIDPHRPLFRVDVARPSR